VELKTAIKNFRKDRYVSSMMREELDTLVEALEQLQVPRAPEVSLAKIEEKLVEALALLKGDQAPANSKSSPKGRKTDLDGAAAAPSVAAKAQR